MEKCATSKIRNPRTNRCVKRDGKIGKSIILSMEKQCSEVYVMMYHDVDHDRGEIVSIFASLQDAIKEAKRFTRDLSEHSRQKFRQVVKTPFEREWNRGDDVLYIEKHSVK